MKRRIITLVSAAILAVLTIATGSAYAAGPAGNLDQCANGPSGTANCTDGAWQNGNLNENQATYFEGDSVPYRLKLTDLGPGTHNLTIEWDTTKSGKHAFDYLTNYNRTETTADPCSSAGFTCSGTNTTFPIPVDTNVAKGQDGVPGTSDDITQIPGVFTLFGGTITGVSGYTLTGPYSGDSATSITITFTTNASVPNLVLAWGGHVSTRINWGSGNSSVAIPGSPWHMRFIDLDGKGGNQDRSLSSAAVIFPGSITITKNAIPDSLTQFGFTASPSPLANFILVDNGAAANTTTFSNIINFTTYNVAESVPTGWTLTNIGCTVISPNGGTQTVSIPDVSIHLKEGEFVTCTFQDERQQATLTLNKVVVNDNGGTNVPAGWTLNAVGPAPSSNVALSGQGTVSGQVEPGTYTLSESTVPGYAAGSWSCTGGAQDGNNITLDPGQNATCTVTNDDIQPVLTVIKHVINDNGGTKVSGDFTMSVAGTNVNPASFAGAEAGTTVTLDAGSYSVNETGPSGYTSNLSADCSGSIAAGETKTCTITNDDIQPVLTVIKHVINDNGGTKVSGDFTMSVAGTNVNPASFAGEESGTTVTLDAGSYSVSETGPSGYTSNLSADCSGSIAAGETKTCTITNDDIQPVLTVIKHVINDNGGTKVSGDFTMSVAGTNVNPASFAGEESGTTVTLDAGSYSVNETGPSGYTSNLSADCSGSIAAGETKTCTITNDDIQPVLTVIKHVINDNGGTGVSGDFTMSVAGTNVNPTSFAGSESGTTVTLDAGSYSVNETGPSGYTSNLSADCSGSIAAGETKTCTITNDDIQPVLTVIKHVINDNGGTGVSGDFTMSVAGTNVNPTSFAGSESGTTVTLDAGSYSVNETGPSGYTSNLSADCSGSIAAGETKTCTITNDDIQPVLTVIKHVINDNGGTGVSGDFTMSVAGTNVNPASFAGEESGTTVTLDAGSYSVSETGPFGYDTSFSTDCTGSIAAGETKICTVTNDDQFRHLSFIKAGALNITGKNLDYTINVTNDGAVNLTVVDITDPTSALTCDITYPKLLAPGESISCTVSYPAETPINATTVIELANPDIILRV